MKVLMINGSPREQGNTSIAVREMENVFDLFTDCRWSIQI